jgi:hypothetical protein
VAGEDAGDPTCLAIHTITSRDVSDVAKITESSPENGQFVLIYFSSGFSSLPLVVAVLMVWYLK